jgi:hypothetical protein
MVAHDEALKKAIRKRKVEKLAERRKNRMQHNNATDKRGRNEKRKPPKVKRPLAKNFAKKSYAADPTLEEDVKREAARRRALTKASNAARNEAKKLQEIARDEEIREVNEARRELAQRELCRKYLIASILRFNPSYLAGWVHKDICVRLEKFMHDIEDGKNPRLMLQMPPRHGKSTIASQEFPAWVLGHHPEWEIMGCSYAESLALDFSRAVRERLRDTEYHVLFKDTKLDRDNSCQLVSAGPSPVRVRIFSSSMTPSRTLKKLSRKRHVKVSLTGMTRRRIRGLLQAEAYLSFRLDGILMTFPVVWNTRCARETAMYSKLFGTPLSLLRMRSGARKVIRSMRRVTTPIS